MDIWKFHLHWGWNPVIFFIVFGISLVLVLTMGKKRVLWLVPALVMYLGLDWALPMSWLFKTIFWIGILVVLATAVFPGRTRFAKYPFALISVVVAFILVLGGFSALGDAVNGDGEPSAEESQTSEPTEIPTVESPAGNEADSCPARFTQRDITDPKLNRFIKGGIDAKTATKSRQKLLAAVGHDASILKIYATQFGIKNLPSEAEMLTDDSTCLSEAGRQVHHDLAVVLNASGVEFGDAPDNVYNSGVNDQGLPVIDTAPGIQGNKKALKVTLPDGSQVIMLVRCGNPVFVQPPDDFVPGPTDNPEPECEDCEPPPPCEDCEPPPTEECPPGQTGTPPNCLEVKHPSEDPGPQGNAPEGGGHNDTNGSGQPDPQPTFPSDPYTPPPPPPPPAPSPTPSPTQSPEGGGSDGGQDNPPGDPGMP